MKNAVNWRKKSLGWKSGWRHGRTELMSLKSSLLSAANLKKVDLLPEHANKDGPDPPFVVIAIFSAGDSPSLP